MFETVVRLPLMVGSRNEGLQPLRDLDNVRSFLGSMGPGAFFDLPWLPFYLAICFAFTGCSASPPWPAPSFW